MTTKYDYPPGLSKSQKRAFRKKMRGQGKAPPDRWKKEAQLHQRLDIPIEEADEMYQTSLIAALRSGDIFAIRQRADFEWNQGYLSIIAASNSRLKFTLFPGQGLGQLYVRNDEGDKVTVRKTLSRETCKEIAELAFTVKARAGNQGPFVYTAGTKARDLVQHFQQCRLWLHPCELPIVEGHEPWKKT